MSYTPKAYVITKQINMLHQELKEVQNKCKHKKLLKKYNGDTGNYDPSCDRYWVDLFCPTCLKSWCADSDTPEYDIFGKVVNSLSDERKKIFDDLK